LAERSHEQRMEMEEYDPLMKLYSECKEGRYCSPIMKYNYINMLAFLRTYKIDLEYNQVPLVVRNMTNKVYNLLKHNYFWQTDVNQLDFQNPEKRILTEVTLDPRTFRMVNVTIRSPIETAIFRDIPLPMMVKGINIKKNPVDSFLYEVTGIESYAKCELHSNSIKTFDDVRYTVPFSSCWSVAAKDCSDSRHFVVMVKKPTMSSEHKEVKIVTKYHKIVLRPLPSSPLFPVDIEINDEKVILDRDVMELKMHGHVVCKVKKMGKYVEVILPETGLKVYFDGYSCDIKMSHYYRHKVCGLCGHYDLETTHEFRLPDYTPTTRMADFFRSYYLREPECTMPELDSFDFSHKPIWEKTEPKFWEDTKYEHNPTKLILKTLRVEKLDMVCFSKIPVAVCPLHTYATQKSERVMVEFLCLPRNNPKTEELLLFPNTEVHDHLVELISMVESRFEREVVIPELCEPFTDSLRSMDFDF
jgi:hypothetical protein